MNISCALISPTPKTTFFLAAARLGHLVQASARSRSLAKASNLASGLSPTTGGAAAPRAGLVELAFDAVGFAIATAAPKPVDVILGGLAEVAGWLVRCGLWVGACARSANAWADTETK